MRHWISTLTTNQRLALAAVVLGVVAIGATPAREGSVTVSPTELALVVQREADHVGVRSLADALVKGQLDFRVVDLRSQAAFDAYHLPTAENIPIAALAAADLPKNDRILVYGDDGVHAAQAWFLLKAKGYRGVYMLRGGLADWKDQVLYPILAAPSGPEQRRDNEQRAAVAAYFGGAPRPVGPAAVVSAPTAVPPSVAPVPAPVLQRPAGAPKAAAKKKKEGC